MPYAKRSYARKAYAKKRVAGGRRFTRYNLYRRRGAKAQANQIYSLNRKVNYVYKACKKPIHYADSDNLNLNNIVINRTGDHAYTASVRELKSLFADFTCRFDGDRDDTHKKTMNAYVSALDPGTEKYRLKNGVIRFSILKKSIDADTSEIVTGFDGVVGIDIYVFQYKQSFNATSTIAAMFGPSEQLRYDMTDVMQPLNSGIWQYIKVLKHKRVYLNDYQYDGKFFKMKFKPYYKTLKTAKMASSGSDNADSTSHSICVAFRLFGESHDNGAKLDIQINYRQYFTI